MAKARPSGVVPVFSGRVDAQGKVSVTDRPGLLAYCRTLADQAIELTVRVRRPRRSDQANRYYWGVCVALIAEHLGYSPEEAHDALKMHLLKVHKDSPLPTVMSTAKMDTAQFAAYVEQVKRFAATELGIYIPEPNEVELAA